MDARLVNALKGKGIPLQRQKEDYQGSFNVLWLY